VLLLPLVRSLLTRAAAELQAEKRAGGAIPDAIEERVSRLRILSDGTDPSLSFAQPAQPPSSPSGTPLIALLLLAALVGGGLAIAAAIAMEVVRPPRIAAEQELEGITGLPVLARVPRLHPRGPREGPLLADVPSGAARAFRDLATGDHGDQFVPG
jgi:hypothetical protein